MLIVAQHCCHVLEMASETINKYHEKKANPAPEYILSELVIQNGKNLKTRRPANRVGRQTSWSI
jgi:hypothetical protein